HGAGLALPIVEVPGDDEWTFLRHGGANAVAQPLELESPAARPQAQVHVDAMQPLAPAGDLDLAMQQPAALERMVRDVDVLPYRDRMAAHDGVAVVAVLVDRVHAVDAVGALVREEFVLRLVGP